MITEGVECSLACLTQTEQKDYLRQKIPSHLEIKLMMLDLLETLNFMHQNAKCVHAGLSPENLYLTVSGKLKIGGLNFCTRIGTEEETAVESISSNIKFNEFHMYPNLRFAAPEISQTVPKCSTQSDLYSFALILYFLLALDRKTDPYLLSQFDVTSPTAHKSELMHLTNKLNRTINCYESEI